ncbi:MAG: TIGR01906 family membrane protein [Chloroflexota bacterium]
MLNILRNFARVIFVSSLAALIFSASIGGAINSRWLYLYGFEKYRVSETTGLPRAELEKAARGLISYFNSDEEFINLTATKNGQPFSLFNEREIVHLKDVKGLVWLDYRVFAVALAYVLVFTLWAVLRRQGKWRFLAGGVLGGSALTLGLMAAMGLGIVFNFNWLFYQFHILSFANDFWQLDPSRDYLIMLFPGGFWFDAFLYCALAAAAAAAILGALAWRYLTRSKTSPGTF